MRALYLLLAAMILLSVTAPAVGFAHEAHEKKAAQAQAQQRAREQAALAAAQGRAGGPHASTNTDCPVCMDGMADMKIEDEKPKTFLGRLANWLGRMHPSVVHFPIAMFVVAGVLEAYALARRKPLMLQTTRVLIALGALGALAAVALGWMAMGFTINADDALHRSHRVLGSLIAVLALATWWANERFVKRRGRAAGLVYAALLAVTVLAILINGYLGGSLTHGVDHMMF